MNPWFAAIQGVLGVDASIQEGIAEQRQTQRNLQLALDAAADSLQRGYADAGQARRAGAMVAAKQKVAYANSGVSADVGTAANVQASTEALAELDAMTLENNAAREAFGYRVHGMDFQTQAGINASRRGREIAGTILGTAGTFASNAAKQKYQRSGGRGGEE